MVVNLVFAVWDITIFCDFQSTSRRHCCVHFLVNFTHSMKSWLLLNTGVSASALIVAIPATPHRYCGKLGFCIMGYHHFLAIFKLYVCLNALFISGQILLSESSRGYCVIPDFQDPFLFLPYLLSPTKLVVN